MCNSCSIELSDRDVNCVAIRPGRLLCLKCLNGGGCLPFMEEEKLDEKGKKYLELPRLDPFDFYFLYNPDSYYKYNY